MTDVLLYHVVSGAVMAETVVGLDSATTVQGSDVTITVNDDGVFLNDTTQVIITDIVASNGVIHVIDSVLLPPPSGMEAEMMEEEMVNIRVAHFSPDTPAVDVFVNGDAAIEGLEFPNITDWIELLPIPTISRWLRRALVSTPLRLARQTSPCQPVSLSTVAAIGSLADGTLAPQVLIEDYSDIDDNTVRLSVFHAIEDAPAVDVWANGARVITQLAYPGTLGNNDGLFVLDVPADTYDIQVVPNGATEPVVLDLPGTVLEAGNNYFVAAVGTLAEPSVALAVSSMVDDMMMEEEMMDEMMGNSIVDIAVADGRFTTLVAAVQAAGLADTLAGEGEFTVFAPTDDAFAALPEGTVEGLLNDIPALTDILLYHVVDGAVMAETVVTLDSATTLQGGDVSITVNDDGVFLNDDIQVIITDIEASNGVIHVIDGVLLPQ